MLLPAAAVPKPAPNPPNVEVAGLFAVPNRPPEVEAPNVVPVAGLLNRPVLYKEDKRKKLGSQKEDECLKLLYTNNVQKTLFY